LRAANARLRELLAERDAEIAALRVRVAEAEWHRLARRPHPRRRRQHLDPGNRI